MSHPWNGEDEPQPPLPAERGRGWTTLDYMLAAGLAWSLAAASPLLMVLPLWVSGLMAKPD